MHSTHVSRYLMMVACLLGVMCVPTLLGDDQAPRSTPDERDRPEAEARRRFSSDGVEVLHELAKLREEVGENVLSGTVLDATPEEARAEFVGGLRKVLGLPDSNTRGTPDRAVDIKTPREIVRLLRDHGVRLDQIASEMEELKQYNHADQLRETAMQLRLIARQFQP